MTYVDGFEVAVPTKNGLIYKKHAGNTALLKWPDHACIANPKGENHA